MSYIQIEEEEGANVSVPTPALLFALALAIMTITLSAIAHHASRGSTATAIHPTATRALVFTDRPGGSVGVYDVEHHEELEPLPAGGGGFVRGALRALARQRRLGAVANAVPFYLARWPDGRLTLDDSSTHNHLELRAFGSANAEAFARMLPPAAR